VAKEARTLVLLDMGGKDEPLTEELLKNVDIISPNEVKTHCITHFRLSLRELWARKLLKWMRCVKLLTSS
jgi:hypothetical protein